MPITKRYDFRFCKQYKQGMINNICLLRNLAKLKPHVTVHNTRKNEPWKIDTCRTRYGLEMIQNKLPRLLNKLHDKNIQPEHISFKELRNFFRIL